MRYVGSLGPDVIRREVLRHRPEIRYATSSSLIADLERGRPMEIDALVGVVQPLGPVTGTPTPTIDLVLALIKQRAQSAQPRSSFTLQTPTP